MFRRILALMLAVASVAATDVETNWASCPSTCSDALEASANSKCDSTATCHRFLASFYPQCLGCFKEIAKDTPTPLIPFSCKPPTGIKGAVQEKSCRMNCHTKAVEGACFRSACYCDRERPLHLEKKEKRLDEHTEYVMAVTVLKDGRVASGAKQTNVIVWDPENGTKIQLTGHTTYVDSLAALHDGSLASGSFDKTIKIWDTKTGGLKKTLNGHTERICALAVLQNGQLASGSTDKTIKIWDVDSETAIHTITDHTGAVCSLTVLDNGYLVSGSNDKTIRFWNPAKNFAAIGGAFAVGGNVVSLTTLVGGRFVSGTSDRQVTLWSSSSFIKVDSKTLDQDQTLTSVQMTRNGNVVIGDSDGYLRYWDLKSSSLSGKVDVHNYAIYSMALLPNGQLVTASGDTKVKVLNTPI